MTATKNGTNSGANEAYQQKRLQIGALIGMLRNALADGDKAQRRDPKNWGFVGNAARVEQLLTEAVQFLTGKEE